MRVVARVAHEWTQSLIAYHLSLITYNLLLMLVISYYLLLLIIDRVIHRYYYLLLNPHDRVIHRECAHGRSSRALGAASVATAPTLRPRRAPAEAP